MSEQEKQETADHMRHRERLLEEISKLTPREKQMMELRFGLTDGRPHTWEEVGREYNVTRERVRWIENKVLRKGCYLVRRKKLTDYLN